MSEQTKTQAPKVTEWLEQEAAEIDKKSVYDGEKLPALKFVEGKLVEFDVDFSSPFKIYDDKINKVMKAIIPATQNGEKKILWLNKDNPLYKELILAGKNGETHFKVLQTGSKSATRYNLVED